MPLEWKILLGLCVAAIVLNWKGPRSRWAAVSLFVALFALSPILPSPAELGSRWYVMCAFIEAGLAFSLWVLSGPASRYLLSLGAYAVALHLSRYFKIVPEETYTFCMLVVEYLQALALIVFSHPVGNAAIALIFRVDLDEPEGDKWTARQRAS